MAGNSVDSAIKKYKVKGTVQIGLGYIIAVFNGFLAFVGGIGSGFKEAFDVAMVIFFMGVAALGVWLVVKGYQKLKLIKVYHNYSARLATDPEKSIDVLASATGVAVEVARKNIVNMLTAGFFPNYYLDTRSNKLVASKMSQRQISNVSANMSNVTNQTVKYITVQCRGCGATNKIVSGTVGECEFCGSQISE